MATKAFPADLSAISPAAGDFLLISDTSDSAASAKVTYQNLFETPPNGEISLGDTTHGFNRIDLADSVTGNYKFAVNTGTLSCTLLSETVDGSDNQYWQIYGGGAAAAGRGGLLRIAGNEQATYAGQVQLYAGGTASSVLMLGTQHDNADIWFRGGTVQATRWTMNGDDGDFYPAAYTSTIGTDSTTTAPKQIFLTDGTVKAEVRGDGIFRTNTDSTLYLGHNAALKIAMGSDSFRPQSDGLMRLGVANTGFSELNLSSKTDANRGAAGAAGRVIFNSDDGNLNIDDGTNWILPDGTTT